MNRISIYLLAATCGLFIVGSLTAKPPLPTPDDGSMIGDMDAYLLKTLYATDDADTGLVSIIKDEQFKALVSKHDLKLFGGPMLGCVTDSSARIWVRTPGPAKVHLVVSPNMYHGLGVFSKLVKTNSQNDFTAVLEINDLLPNTQYYYDVMVDGYSATDPMPTFRTSPAKGQKTKFDVVFGGGARYNPPKEKMWDVIASHKPAALLMLGDNVYIDLPESRTKQRVHYYRRQLRPEFRRLTGSAAVYAIYDDHDLGKDDCKGGPEKYEPLWKYQAWKVFKENWVNPYYGGDDKLPGCWLDFSIGDVDFFMVDNRYYRSFPDGTMLGPDQKKWLLEKLKASKATFKVIASGTLWTEHADKGGKDSWWGVPEEREEIFSFIDQNNINGVILLSADRHRTDVYKIERPNGYDLYEFETSKLTNDHTHPTKKQAIFSYNKGNYFGKLTFDLTRPDPEMTFQCITMDNQSVYQLTLKRSQLEKK